MTIGRSLVVAVAAVAATLALAAPASAQVRRHAPCSHGIAVDPYGSLLPPGELGRLEVRAFDYLYRNSNDNVFRNSRHASPLGNPFRSSRHYRQKLAASYDSRPLRTFVSYTEGRGADARERVFSYAHPRSSVIRNYARYAADPLGYAPLAAPAGTSGPCLASRYDECPFCAAEAEASRPRPRSRAEIEMVPVSIVPPAPPKERTVMKTVTDPDGTVRTIITSVPIEQESD